MVATPLVDLHTDLTTLRTPLTLAFFDPCGDHALNFLCPHFQIVGFTVECLVLDVMHVFDLGITQWLIGTIFFELIGQNAFASENRYALGQAMNNMIGLRRRMAAYYKTLPPRQRGRASRVGKITLKMLGKRSKPQ